jgi:hypothetical protein
MRLGASLLIFQFKASNVTVSRGRRFTADHKQMEALRSQCRSFGRRVFYVFPLIGSTRELASNSDFIGQSWLLDVAALPPIGPPVTLRGTLRKGGFHWVYVVPGRAEICSEPTIVKLLSAADLNRDEMKHGDFPQATRFEGFEDFWTFRELLGPFATAAVVT